MEDSAMNPHKIDNPRANCPCDCIDFPHGEKEEPCQKCINWHGDDGKHPPASNGTVGVLIS